jgi:Tol biopolymer transport system component
MPSWSPDGKTIAFMGLPFTGEWGIYMISADDGTIRSVSDADHAQGFPDWSPDGHHLAFGEVVPLAQPRGIHILDLGTNAVHTLPDSKDYSFPRWSPNGRFIVALHAGDQALWLFDFQSNQWRRLADRQGTYPNWSRDGLHVYFVSNTSEGRAVFRTGLIGGVTETVADLATVERTPFFMGDWVGLNHDDAPLAIRNLTTDDIYSWDLVGR